ncbi:MAG: hypothetical protein R2713_00825 [Ilumatobacteraceae bacterium]
MLRNHRPAAGHRSEPGASRDTACYSILPDEWPPIRAHLAARIGRSGTTGASGTSGERRATRAWRAGREPAGDAGHRRGARHRRRDRPSHGPTHDLVVNHVSPAEPGDHVEALAGELAAAGAAVLVPTPTSAWPPT